jgi:hypothetical protein
MSAVTGRRPTWAQEFKASLSNRARPPSLKKKIINKCKKVKKGSNLSKSTLALEVEQTPFTSFSFFSSQSWHFTVRRELPKHLAPILPMPQRKKPRGPRGGGTAPVAQGALGKIKGSDQFSSSHRLPGSFFLHHNFLFSSHRFFFIFGTLSAIWDQ